jgi:hypothetical protein
MSRPSNIEAFLADIRTGLPLEDAQAIHGLADFEVEDLAADIRKAEAQLSATMVGVLHEAAAMGDTKAAQFILERRNKAYARQTKADVAVDLGGVELSLPSNGRERTH